MKKQNQGSKTVQDERVEFVTNKYAANAFIFLCYYLFISIIIKSFTLDVNIFIYWDNAIAMVIAGAYMIYRSANKGVPVAPGGVKVMEAVNLKGFAFVSLLFGVFVSFVVSGMDERLTALMPGFFEKLAGAVVIGFLFFLLMIVLIWLIDVLPTRRAFRKAAELTGEKGLGMPDNKEIIKQTYAKDERIDSTIEKYGAHAFYVVAGYILVSSLVKIFTMEVNMIYYFDAFLAAMAACGYFSYKILQAGVYEEQKLNKKEKLTGGFTFAAACLAYGLFVSFIVFPMEEELAAKLDGFSAKLSLGLLLAALFGVGMYLAGKGFDWYAKKRAEKLMESD
jgi:uncharacterized protein (DUF2062 family)